MITRNERKMNEIQVPLLQEIRLRWPLAGVACAVLALPATIFPRREGWGEEGQGWKGWFLWGWGQKVLGESPHFWFMEVLPVGGSVV